MMSPEELQKRNLSASKARIDQAMSAVEGYEGMDPSVRPTGEPLRAQEMYAQTVLDYLNENAESMEGVLYYRGSVHTLVKQLCPKAQVGAVVGTYLKGLNAITNVSHGYWRVNRQKLYFDNSGALVSDTLPEYANVSRTTALEDRELGMIRKMQELERTTQQLVQVMMAFNQKLTDAYERINLLTEKMQENGVVFTEEESTPLVMDTEGV